MSSLTILSFLKSANLFLIYFAVLTSILLIIRHYNREEKPESQMPWMQALHATVHGSVWFMLIRLLEII